MDDALSFNPKILAAGNAAVGAWVRMCAYSSAHGLDGRVPSSVAQMIANARELASLVQHRLLHEIDDEFEIHDFLHYNPSAAEFDDRRDHISQIRRAAGRKGGMKSAEKRGFNFEANQANLLQANQANGQANSVAKSEQTTPGFAQALAVAANKPRPVPSRPGEEKNTMRGRASEPEPIPMVPGWFTTAWMQRAKISMLAPSALCAVWSLVQAYAEAVAGPPDVVTPWLFDAYQRVTADWDSRFNWEPHLFVKHFDRIQAAVARSGAPHGPVSRDGEAESHLASDWEPKLVDWVGLGVVGTGGEVTAGGGDDPTD